ncbi:hypothetical protein [Modestobacter sp. DSM 44400]|nr:hypothetical protein [Modestobacter sp. DSM 44400]
MPHLLHLDASADPRTSASRTVTAAFVETADRDHTIPRCSWCSASPSA